MTFRLSTPSLCTFVYLGIPRQKLCESTSDLSSIKYVTIDVCHKSNSKNTALSLLNWLVELANIESLTVSLNTLKVLSLVPDLLKVEFPSLYSLKSLKIKQCSLSSKPKEIVDFLLQNSPSAKVDTFP
ncbi:hypothetical protein QL285_011624 [Trifolium repens]|nr:hypothetical protein QL285_011624 [Trifolium repens]